VVHLGYKTLTMENCSLVRFMSDTGDEAHEVLYNKQAVHMKLTRDKET